MALAAPTTSGTAGASHDAHACIVGAGPAGVVLALLLARRGLRVVLLEAAKDLDRDFRGDTIHPNVLEVLDQLGLAERLLALPHARVSTGVFETAEGRATLFELGALPTRFPFLAVMPQARFLAFLTEEARRWPGFELRMGARVRELVVEEGVVRGVRYEGEGGAVEVRARLVVGADGRSSTVRELAGLVLEERATPMDVLWFRIPRPAGQPAGLRTLVGGGHLFVLLDRGETWQVGCVVPKGAYRDVRAEGLGTMKRDLVALAPELAAALEELQDWRQVAFLAIRSGRVRRWHRPGLLLLGDAAHVMTPVGGVGINVAIQDAVVAANVLARPLGEGTLRERHLRSVQRRRHVPVALVQRFQSFVQRRMVAVALDPGRPMRVPPPLRLAPVRRLIGRVVGFGLWRVRLRPGPS